MFPALERLYQAAECRTQMELAAFLDVRQPSISVAKKRGTIPADWLLKLLRKKGVNPDWILTGQGPGKLLPVEYSEAAPAHFSRRSNARMEQP